MRPMRVIKTASKRYIQVFSVTRVGHWWSFWRPLYMQDQICWWLLLCPVKARSTQYLALLEVIANVLYFPPLCRLRRKFDILCLFDELCRNWKTWDFFYWNLPTLDSLNLLLIVSGVFCEKSLDKRVPSICFIVLSNKLWLPWYTS